MAYSFNLLRQPWLPCIRKDNRLQSLSLTEAITQAHQLKGIQGRLPTITGALYLLLIAFATRIFQPENDQEWENLWQSGIFSEAAILAYAKKWENRFDLFDADFPFYQDPKFGMREKDKKNLKKGKLPEPKGISGLLLHLASGKNPTLFDHSLDDLPVFYSPSETAQLLIMLQAYSLGGMSSASIGKDKYYKDSPFGRGILFLNKGRNVFETLLMHLFPRDSGMIKRTGDDQPAWEKDDAFETERYDSDGVMDLLTWQSRRILLIPEETSHSIVVKNLFTAPGHGLVETFSNPLYHNQITQSGKKQSIKPLRFQEGRSLWRDSAAILNTHTINSEPPVPVRWAEHLRAFEILKEGFLLLDLYGMCTEPGQKKAYFYAHDIFSAPIAYLENPALLEDLQGGLNLAEEVRKDLYIAVRELARYKIVPMHDQENVREPGRDDTDPLIRHWDAEQKYWSYLETAFYEYLVSLPESVSAHDVWEDRLRQAARDALNFAADQVGTDPAGLKARAKSEKALNSRLYRTFNPPEKE